MVWVASHEKTRQGLKQAYRVVEGILQVVGCKPRKNPPGIETHLTLEIIETEDGVASHEKTRQGLKRRMTPPPITLRMELQATKKPARD